MGRVFKKIVLWLLILGLAVTVLPVLLLRWVPAPTSAFMLQSETRPVKYQWVSRDKISDSARRAVIAAEDQKFWMHNGFDLEAIEKAYQNNQKKKRRIRGASTISQQTAKNLFLWSGGGYFRKGLEAGYTLLLEWICGKERILEIYLNIAEFGPGIYGVQAASQTYFRKNASQLSNWDAARLAAVLPNPRRWKVASPGPYVQKRTGWIAAQIGPRPKPVEEDEPLPMDDNDAPAVTTPEASVEPPAESEPAPVVDAPPQGGV